MGKYFNKLAELKPYDKARVELWTGWNGNYNQESREEMVATIASLSYGNEQAKNPTGLYNRLKKLKHESLFEFINKPVENRRIENSLRHTDLPFSNRAERNKHKECIATFKVKVPIFVARQFMRHRCFSYLELSRRYTKPNKIKFEFYKPDLSGLPKEEQNKIKDFYIIQLENAVNMYSMMVKSGIKSEIARGIIPVSSYTEFWVQGDVECFTNFFNLRLKSDAQKEIRYIAQAMAKLLEKYQPELYFKTIKEFK